MWFCRAGTALPEVSGFQELLLILTWHCFDEEILNLGAFKEILPLWFGFSVLVLSHHLLEVFLFSLLWALVFNELV